MDTDEHQGKGPADCAGPPGHRLKLSWETGFLIDSICRGHSCEFVSIRGFQLNRSGLMSAGSLFHKSLHVFLGLGDAQHFFNGGHPGLHLDPAVIAQRPHALLDRPLRDG